MDRSCAGRRKSGKRKSKRTIRFRRLGKKKVTEVQAGDICAVVGFDAFQIGDSFVDLENPEPLERTAIDEPTLNMTFSINNSPFFGKDGKYVTSNHLKERLTKN
jgi:GTP-binding protein